MNKLQLQVTQLGSAKWQTTTTQKNFSAYVSIGDFNGDRFHDIAVNVCDVDGSTPDIQILLGNSGGAFSHGTSILGKLEPTYQAANPIWTEDINKDGISDIIIGNSNGDQDTTTAILGGKQVIYLSERAGSYKLITSEQSIYAHHTTVSDVNGDGYLDIFFTAVAVGPSLLALFDPISQSFKFTTDGLPSKALQDSKKPTWEEISRKTLSNGDIQITYSDYHNHNSQFLDTDRDGDQDLIMFFNSQDALIFPNILSDGISFSNENRISIDTKIDDPALSALRFNGAVKTIVYTPGSNESSSLQVIQSGFNPYETQIFDINNDGWSDILVSGTYDDERYLQVNGKTTYEVGSDRFNDGTLYEVLISNGKTLVNETKERIQQFGPWDNDGYHDGFIDNLKLVDLNGDGFLDFTSNSGFSAAPNRPSYPSEVTKTAFMLNDGAGHFSRIEIPGLDHGSFTPIPILGKLGFVHVQVAGHRFSAPDGSTEATFFVTSTPWTVGDVGNNFLYGTPAWDLIDGLAGRDTFYANGRKTDFDLQRSVSGQPVIAHKSGLGGNDTLISVERIRFDDGVLVFDVTSANASAAYRLYGGAFARTPDEGGFRFWASTLDKNASLRDVATQFINSGEFIGRYGSSLSNAAFVDALYQNVLSRGGDAGGVAYWNKMLDNKLQDRSDVLVEFTQLPEFVGISAANISNGYWVV